MLPDFFLLLSFPCSADHERDWPQCKVFFFGLATNTLNMRNDNCCMVRWHYYRIFIVVVFFTLTDRASTIPSNIHTWLSIRYVVCWTGKRLEEHLMYTVA